MQPTGRRDDVGPGRTPADDAHPLQWDFFEYLPVTVQDVSGEVLMIQYMTQEAFERTKQERSLWLWSRSREAFWMAGREGGGYDVVDLRSNCMGDSLLAVVDARGRLGCHLGNTSCFSVGQLPTDERPGDPEASHE